jgi:hypothetical protein
MTTGRTQTERNDERSPVRRAAEIAVGGTALAARKAAETLEKAADEAAEHGEELVRRGEKALRRGSEETRDRAHGALRDTRKAVEPDDTRPYEERTRDELYQLAVDRDIRGRSAMRKAQLIDALREHR